MNSDLSERFPKEILLVEGDPSMRRALTHILAGAGYVVSTTSDGALAAQLLATAPAFDLVIVDIFVPRRDAVCVLSLLRAHPQRIPVIAMGGEQSTEGAVTAGQAQLLGADLLLPKPFTPAEFLEAVSLALDWPSGHRTGSAS